MYFNGLLKKRANLNNYLGFFETGINTTNVCRTEIIPKITEKIYKQYIKFRIQSNWLRGWNLCNAELSFMPY